MEARFCPLFSGSSGNAIYVGYGDTHLLIDAGLPGKAVGEALLSIGHPCHFGSPFHAQPKAPSSYIGYLPFAEQK